jgi:hypothetical protein
MRAHDVTHWSVPLALAAISLVAACGGKDAQQANGTPTREIQLAPSASTQPQLGDSAIRADSAPTQAPVVKRHEPRPKRVAVTPEPEPMPAPQPEPVAPAPEPAPVMPAPPPAPTMGTIASGTTFAVQPAVHVCTNTYRVGDRVSASLGSSVRGTDGAVIPAGSPVTLRVAESARMQSAGDSIRLSFDVVSVRVGETTYSVDGHVAQTAPVEKVRVQSTGDQAKKVGLGAAIGALAGQLLGHNTGSTVIGGVVGGAAGGVVAAGTTTYDGCVATGAPLAITLNRPLHIRIGS